MARGRIASKIQKKLNFLVFGEPFSGKSTFASQFAYMHNEDGSPMRVLYIDCESGSIDNYIDEILGLRACNTCLYSVCFEHFEQIGYAVI